MGVMPVGAGDLSGGGHAADRDDEREMAGLEGTLTHRLLSEIDARTTREQVVDRIPGLLLSVAARGARAGDSLAGRVVTNVMGFLGSGVGKRILSRGGAKAEFGIFATFDDAVLTGILDRVYEGEDGRYEFLDYKTDTVPAEEISVRAESYRTQMAAYALLLERLFRQNEVTGRLLFLKNKCHEIRFDFSASDIDEFSLRIRAAIGGIRRREFSPPHEACRGCPYREGKKCLVAPGIV
jgi:hypothetical protein